MEPVTFISVPMPKAGEDKAQTYFSIGADMYHVTVERVLVLKGTADGSPPGPKAPPVPPGRRQVA